MTEIVTKNKLKQHTWGSKLQMGLELTFVLVLVILCRDDGGEW